MRYLLDPNADIALLESVLEVPDFVSGISDQDRALILTVAIERRHPGALAAIDQVQEAAELVEVCARVAFDTARRGNFFRVTMR